MGRRHSFGGRKWRGALIVRNVGCPSLDEGAHVQTSQGDMQYDDQWSFKELNIILLLFSTYVSPNISNLQMICSWEDKSIP
jgi:hypothetical protein